MTIKYKIFEYYFKDLKGFKLALEDAKIPYDVSVFETNPDDWHGTSLLNAVYPVDQDNDQFFEIAKLFLK